MFLITWLTGGFKENRRRTREVPFYENSKMMKWFLSDLSFYLSISYRFSSFNSFNATTIFRYGGFSLDHYKFFNFDNALQIVINTLSCRQW
ncbi:MAG: hypothetical protein ACLRSW_14080 [Christensenellaceae bacterium]